MTTPIPAHRHAYREGTASQWVATNPVLGAGEDGRETDTGWHKVGDGITHWNDLTYDRTGPAGAPGSTDMTFADNGDNTGTIGWDTGTKTALVAILTGGKLLPTSVIPAVALTIPTVVANQAAMLALTAQAGDVAIRSDTSTAYMLAANGDPTVLSDWLAISQPGGVTSVNGQTGVIVLAASDVGALAAASNLSDVADATTALANIGALAAADARVAPSPTLANAGKVVTVKADGSGYELDTASGASLSYLSGSLASDVSLSTTAATVDTLSGFTAGKWLVNISYQLNSSSTALRTPQLKAIAGTGSPTFSGPQAGEVTLNNTSGVSIGEGRIAFSFILTCTAASTVTIQGVCSGGTGCAARAATPTGAVANASGWTAVKIA